MASETGVNLRVLPASFLAAYAALLEAKVDATNQYDESDAATRAVAAWPTLVDDFMIACQEALQDLYRGTGSPEGVVVAPVGARYIREDGGVGTTIYVKETGSLAEGWSPLTSAASANGIPLGSHTARSIVGRAANSSGDAADIAGGGSAADVHVFSDNGTTVASRSLLTILDSDASRWSTVQDIDMGAWSSTDFTSGGDGTVSVGGLTWNKANVTAADGAPGYFRRNASDVGDDGGGGVRILHDASLSTTLTTSANSAPHLWITLASLDAAYDETAEYVLQLHVTRLTESGSITNSQPTRLAMLLHAPSGTPTGTAARVAGVSYRRNGSGDWRPNIETNGTTDTSRSDQSYSTSNVLSLHFGPRGLLGFSGLYSGGWPTFASLTSVGFRASSQSSPNWVDVYNHRNTRVALVAASGVSNTGSIDVMFRRMRLLRRRAA
jgi:hypothetical protein